MIGLTIITLNFSLKDSIQAFEGVKSNFKFIFCIADPAAP